jgi:hypothetical protein
MPDNSHKPAWGPVAVLLLIVIGGMWLVSSHQSQSNNVPAPQNSDSSDGSDTATTPPSGTITRNTMLFTTTAGFCEWINEEEALRLGRRYTPHGDMGQTETGQLVNSGDFVQIGLTVQTACRDLWGKGSERNPVWVQDETNGAEGYIEQNALER